MLKCPKCGQTEKFYIAFTGECQVFQDKEGEIEGSEDCGNHEWGCDDHCRCSYCDYMASVANFTVEEESSAETK